MASVFEKERRALYVMTGLTLFGALIMFIAVCTDYWLLLKFPNGVYNNVTGSFMVGHHSGLWRICWIQVDDMHTSQNKREHCHQTKLFDPVDTDPEVDKVIQDYSRTETAFAVIGLGLMALGHVFAIYSLKEPRYMFKRVAAFMHLITGVCVLVCIEVLSNSVNHERDNLPARHPKYSTLSYGYSYVLAWITFVIYIGAALLFLVCSRKRKGEKAENEEEAKENEPMQLGRN